MHNYTVIFGKKKYLTQKVYSNYNICMISSKKMLKKTTINVIGRVPLPNSSCHQVVYSFLP